MICLGPAGAACLVPLFSHLESLRMLSFTATSGGQDGSDFVGPHASQGNDGIVVLHLDLSGLSTSVGRDQLHHRLVVRGIRRRE